MKITSALLKRSRKNAGSRLQGFSTAGDPGEALPAGALWGPRHRSSKATAPGAKETALELSQGENVGITQPGLEGLRKPSRA